MSKPRIEFDAGSVLLDAGVLCWPVFRAERSYQDELLGRDPQLGPIVQAVRSDMTREELFPEVKERLLRLYEDRFTEIAASIRRFQRVWDPLNAGFMSALSEVLGIPWPDDLETIVGHVSVLPFGPRWVALRRFNAPYRDDDAKIVATSAHETAHFLYFHRLRELDPCVAPETFEAPHRTWLVSELFAPLILNDPRVAAVIGPTPLETYVCAQADLERLWHAYRGLVDEGAAFSRVYSKICELAEDVGR